MKHFTTSASVLLATTSLAFAGGVDRSGQFLGPLFEKGGETGSHVSLGFGRISPSAEASNLGVSNPLIDYNSVGLAYKTDFTDTLSFALILEEPYGADIQYPLASPFVGGGASVSSEQVTAVLRYKFNENWSVHGGIRALQMQGNIDTFTANPFATGPADALLPITANANSDVNFGGLVGVAYERPEIALRVALTYSSSIGSEFSGSETLFGDAARTIPIGAGPTSFTVDSPKSFNLEFQSGVAENTLVFGSIRHARYDGYNLTTPVNTALFGGALGEINYVNFTSNTTTYNLGVGRRFNDRWAGTVSISYEAPGTKPSTTALAPTTGSRGIAVGARYSGDVATISGGVSYIIPGDQDVNSAVGIAQFNDNDAVAFGLRVGFDF